MKCHISFRQTESLVHRSSLVSVELAGPPNRSWHPQQLSRHRPRRAQMAPSKFLQGKREETRARRRVQFPAPVRSFTQMPIHMDIRKVTSRATEYQDRCRSQSWVWHAAYQAMSPRQMSFGSFVHGREVAGLRYQRRDLRRPVFTTQVQERVAVSTQLEGTSSRRTLRDSTLHSLISQVPFFSPPQSSRCSGTFWNSQC